MSLPSWFLIATSVLPTRGVELGFDGPRRFLFNYVGDSKTRVTPNCKKANYSINLGRGWLIVCADILAKKKGQTKNSPSQLNLFDKPHPRAGLSKYRQKEICAAAHKIRKFSSLLCGPWNITFLFFQFRVLRKFARTGVLRGTARHIKPPVC